MSGLPHQVTLSDSFHGLPRHQPGKCPPCVSALGTAYTSTQLDRLRPTDACQHLSAHRAGTGRAVHTRSAPLRAVQSGPLLPICSHRRGCWHRSRNGPGRPTRRRGRQPEGHTAHARLANIRYSRRPRHRHEPYQRQESEPYGHAPRRGRTSTAGRRSRHWRPRGRVGFRRSAGGARPAPLDLADGGFSSARAASRWRGPGLSPG